MRTSAKQIWELPGLSDEEVLAYGLIPPKLLLRHALSAP